MLPNKPDGETDVVVHMKEIGNKEYKNITKDTLIGTTGQNRRLEAIRITGHALRLEAIRINPYGKTIKAKVHIQSKGWVDYGMITKDMILSILVYTLFSRMFDLMQPPAVKHSIAVV